MKRLQVDPDLIVTRANVASKRISMLKRDEIVNEITINIGRSLDLLLITELAGYLRLVAPRGCGAW